MDHHHNKLGIDNYTWGVAGTSIGVGCLFFNSLHEFLELFSTKPSYQYLYMFSEVGNQWFIASRDNQVWRSLASEL